MSRVAPIAFTGLTSVIYPSNVVLCLTGMVMFLFCCPLLGRLRGRTSQSISNTLNTTMNLLLTTSIRKSISNTMKIATNLILTANQLQPQLDGLTLIKRQMTYLLPKLQVAERDYHLVISEIFKVELEPLTIDKVSLISLLGYKFLKPT